MSETKLIVRDETQDVSMICHGSDAHRVVAALSADPVTIEELEMALQRFMNVERHGFFAGAACIGDEPWDSGLVAVDLTARLIVIQSSYFGTSHSGQVFYQNGQHCTNIPVGYSLANEWEINSHAGNWRERAAIRRRERIGKATCDARAILYGRPMLEFLARGCWAAFATLTENPPPQSQLYDLLKGIHASWLMTPCPDLQNQTPRDKLLAARDHLSVDMEHRCDQWARTLECPRGLDATSHAFRFGGFGTHELVKYYDLVRALLQSCWDELTELANSARSESVEPLDFLSRELSRLERVRDEWFHTPDPDCHLRTPQSIIDRERVRLPEALFGRDAMIDPDCPCCQMLAELPGPTFMHLDSSGMDWEFPFDIYCRTQAEWDAQQSEFAEFKQSQDGDEQQLGAIGSDNDTKGASSVWSRSFSMAESTDLPLGVRLLGIAWHVAELVMELNERTNSTVLIDQLNRDFRSLREALSGNSNCESTSMVDQVLEQFVRTLGNTAAKQSELEPRCSDLARKVRSLREPHAPISS